VLKKKTTKILSLTAGLWAHKLTQDPQNTKSKHYQHCNKILLPLKESIFDGTDLDVIFRVALKNLLFSEYDYTSG
jgi:hypothetical protein